MGGAITYTWWGRARVTPWMSYQLSRLDGDLRRSFGVALIANSGIRTAQEQIDIFLSRYVTAGNVKGRYVYDTRWWNGQLWYRISAAGTVAAPGSSNHEIQGSRAAVDIADTGATGGITNRNSIRGVWLRQNAWRYGMVASGDGFGEGWHFDINNIFNTPPADWADGGSEPFPTPEPVKDYPMELVIKAPNGIVIHFAPGIRHDFASVEEYAAISGDLEVVRAKGGTDALPLPPLGDVVGVSWEAYIRFCAYFNVPTAPDES